MAVKHCECCGAIIPPPITFQGRIRQAIFNYIIKHRGRRVTTEELISAAYGNRDDGGPMGAANIICITILHMNKILANHGLKIKGYPGAYCGGYELQELK
ncbi:MAG: hypothetical protein KGL39_56615 [Patescibacteria group bacterium]|nr:hypothetical protein [Patescibacteria group bacterium]